MQNANSNIITSAEGMIRNFGPAAHGRALTIAKKMAEAGRLDGADAWQSAMQKFRKVCG
jgi:hypothetical protein